jgi:molybdopterin-binding protein
MATLVTARGAAASLGVSYSTFKQWIYKGAVRTVRTSGGHHRIAESEIERLLARRGGARPKVRRRPGPAPIAISGRNQLRGIVEEIRVEGLLAQVQLRLDDQRLTAVITRDAVDALRLRRGAPAIAVIKSTEVMIAVDPDVDRP